jgi:protocatechuate 3,4-dioxygenase beta subunit
MKTLHIILLLIFLFPSSLVGQPAYAEQTANPSLYYTQAELTILKSLKTAPSHSAMWNNISSWAQAHYNDAPPAQSTVGPDFKEACEEIKQFLDKMTFMYHMTDDTKYADAAVTWMKYVAQNWNGWYPARAWDPQYFRSLASGLGNAYYALRDYMSESDRALIANNMATYSYPCYERYYDHDSPITGGNEPSKSAAVAEVLGTIGLGLGSDSENSDIYVNLATQCADEAVEYGGGPDGGWGEGPSYSIRSNGFTRLFAFYDALRRIKGIDRFITYQGFLSNVPYYFIYMSVPNDYETGLTPMQIEDTTGRGGYFAEYSTALSFLYKAAREFHNGYAQMAGDTYDSHTTALSYIWKSPDLSPLELSTLPLYRVFDSVGYVIWKASWDEDALTFLFKSGRSYNHAHPNQNTFMIYKNGRPLTAGTGYATTWTEYKGTEFNNCLTVGNILGKDGKLYGYGQAKEPGDVGGAEVPLGTGGHIIANAATDVYFYVAGDASDLYTGQVYNETNTWPLLSSGKLNKWARHMVFFPDLQYFVTFDDVISPVAQQVNWWFSNKDLYNEYRVGGSDNPPPITWNGNLMMSILPGGAGVPVERRVEIKMLEPTSFSTTVDENTGAYNSEFSYTLAWPTTNIIAPRFLTVMTADNHLSTGYLQTIKIEQGNCLGVMVDSGAYRDLILFSTDGKPVSQNIELGGYFQSADGNPYTFIGTQVLADFNTYKVMRLKAGTSANRAPVLNPIGNKTVTEGQSLTFTISATDPDGDPLTCSASNLPSWASFNPATRTFSGTPNQAGSYSSVHFQVSDGALINAENIIITVTNVNRPPVLNTVGNKTVKEGQSLTFTVSATDPDSDPLTYSASNLPAGATFNPAKKTFTWTPGFSQAGTYPNVHFQVSDGVLTDAGDITITVTNVNRPPVLNTIGKKTVAEGQSLTFTVSATDPDGDPLTYSAANLPSGATFDPAARTFSWTPNQAGSYSNVRFQVSDGALTDAENITITVNAGAPMPSPSSSTGGGTPTAGMPWYRIWWLWLIVGLAITAIVITVALLRRFV